MTVEEALYSILSGNAGVAALVSTRIYPVQPPQGATAPWVVYSKAASPRELTYGQDLGGHPHFDLVCTGKTFDSAAAVSLAVRAALQNYTGLVGGAGGCSIVAAQQQNEVDMYDPQYLLYHRILDFRISYGGV